MRRQIALTRATLARLDGIIYVLVYFSNLIMALDYKIIIAIIINNLVFSI